MKQSIVNSAVGLFQTLIAGMIGWTLIGLFVLAFTTDEAQASELDGLEQGAVVMMQAYIKCAILSDRLDDNNLESVILAQAGIVMGSVLLEHDKSIPVVSLLRDTVSDTIELVMILSPEEVRGSMYLLDCKLMVVDALYLLETMDVLQGV